MKKMLIAMVVCAFLAVSVAPSQAAWLWNQSILKVQAGATSTILTLKNSDGSGANRNYAIDSNFEKNALAVALTAISLGKNVHANVNGSGELDQLILSDE
ncbi:hypothetical protein [Pseudodesulfovibrio senegalensis]|uniref:Uncharacterized protein n=1 Tax=Pseudodesulfovibrio senegalensis TaxID=1721087 RepID=A0A6N6N322_9BACT|nr:hypothetical protein [Pseudodesulfovibrio senegalensis]KAB1441442.1 hypothetical protein F8A88_10890 [Pseudodesulfovibrio senegalensis]